ncbi:bacterio-opsin activator-like protein [Haladaptatus paucihalophilus DX253]|uniref:Bacterio-opsin activator-like protein n=1 Tax=Haladaptatus paucihalophilus DX253 TaxID=797209 RepID=E7QWP3_HALPU|nr:bacterio-opsin activator domain-containing protein [Haladaptatus paucihalophilus]EFW91139.1 bacterio-opsin activator-like protein [Haladaptatus paucihalophilus DX253]SHL36133.1 hypothetical protein SAMN05444342_3646 [Haladaptatus paucihalophilus DX253]
MTRDGGDEFLTTTEYERLRRATETYREDLIVALAGRVGLRPSELTRIRPADLCDHDHDGDRFFFLTVPEGDDETREAYVPRAIAHDLQKYRAANDIDTGDPFIAVSPRRVQMIVSDVADRVDGPCDVTCRDLRKHFAWRHLVEEHVDPRVVQSVGGWKRLDSLTQYYPTPTTATIIDAFTTQPPTRSGHRRGRPGRPDSRIPAPESRRTDRLACMEALGRALTEASTDEDVRAAACDQLADLYRGVWLCDERGATRASVTPPRTTDDHAENGNSKRDTDGATDNDDESDVPGAILDATDALDGAESGAVTVVDASSVAADIGGVLSGCSFAVAPLESSETVHGVVCVAGDSFRSADRTLLADAGRRIGLTLTSIERKRLLLTDTGVALSLRSTDSSVFLVAASAELDCQFSLDGVVPIEEHSLLYFVTASGAAVSEVLDRVTDAEAVEDARLIRDYGEDALFEFTVSGESLATILIERGGNVRELSAQSGMLDVSGVFSRHADVRSVVEAVEDVFPETDLCSKREVEVPTQGGVRVQQSVQDRLTERQRTVLRAAYLAGYFEWPRGSTAEELASSMGVSSPTLHNHLRKAQQKLLDSVFEETDPALDETE